MKEVRERLLGRGFGDEIISAVIDRLKQQNYLDDCAFTRMWIMERVAARKWGKNKIRMELRKKGVAREIIDKELSCYSEQDEKEFALELARKKYAASGDLEPEKRYRRLYELLNRHGFNGHIVRQTMREVESYSQENPG